MPKEKGSTMEEEKKLRLILRMIQALLTVIADELEERIRKNERKLEDNNQHDYFGN